MLVYIFHLHEFSVIYWQGYITELLWTSCLQSVILLCFIFIYIYNTQKSQSFRALTSSYFTFFHDMLSFNQIFLVYGYGCNFFSLFVLCQTILKNIFKSIYRILYIILIRFFVQTLVSQLFKSINLQRGYFISYECIKLFFIYVYTKYISCYCNVLLLIFIIII